MLFFCMAVLIGGCGESAADSTTEMVTSSASESDLFVPSSAETDAETIEESTTGQTEADEQKKHISPDPVQATYRYPIEELGIELEIPENIYAYRINGIYRDWTGKLNIHSFSEWIVLSCKEYEESELELALRDNYLEEAKHIVFVLSICPEQLYPAQRLCFGLFSGGDLHKKGNYYFDTLYCGTVNRDPVTWIGAYSSLGKDAIAVSEKWSRWVDKWELSVESASLPAVNLSVVTDATLAADGLKEWPEAYEDTIVVEEVWDRYQKAVQELTDHPETYVYVEEEISPLIEKVENWAIQLGKSHRDVEEAQLLSVHADHMQDIYIRALLYVRYSKWWPDQVTGLNDIVVILQDWDEDRQSYVAYCRNDDGSYTEISAGYNCFNDLQAARDYIQYGSSLGQ